MLRRTLLVILPSLLPLTAAAQHAARELPAPGQEQSVTATLAAHLAPSSGGSLAVPLPLLERLAKECSPLALYTAPVDGRVVVQARFGFAELAAFRRWPTGQATVQLLASFRAITLGESSERFISHRPGS